METLTVSEQLPSIYHHTDYSRKISLNIRGDFNYIKDKILKYSLVNGFYPDFIITSLGNDMYDITDATPDAEPQYFVAKYVPFREKKPNQDYFTFQIQKFYLRILSTKLSKVARMKITHADLFETTQIHLHHILKKDTSSAKSNEVKYTFKVDIVNCERRNVADELLNIFMAIGQ